MKVICFGDSNTYGYDPRSFWGGRYPDPWPELLARKTGWQVINQGENGMEIPRLSFAFPEDTDLLIVMLGTNDLLQGRTAEETAARMEHFLAEIPMKKDNILLLAPPPMALGEWVQDRKLMERTATLGELYQALAARLGVQFAPLEYSFALAYDGVHLTEEGHRALANVLYTLLKEKENRIC